MDELIDLPIPDTDPAEVGRRVDAILSGREYRPPSRSPLERLFDWIGERLGDFVGAVTGGGRGTLVGVVILAATIAFVIWLVARRGSFRFGPAPLVDRPSLHSETDERVAPEVWLGEADRLLAAGDHRGAIRCWYEATVETLRERGTVALDPGRTVGEFRVDLLAAPLVLQDDFGALAGDYLDAWYGGRSVDAAEAVRCRELAASIAARDSLVGATR